jgi:hypothetical protein
MIFVILEGFLLFPLLIQCATVKKSEKGALMAMKDSYLKRALDHHSKQIEMEDDIREYSNIMQHDISKELWRVVEQDKGCPLYANKNFYVVIMWQRRRVGWAIGYPVISRISCPTPTPQQTVFKYRRIVGDLQFLWTLPTQATIDDYVLNKSKWLDVKDKADSCKFAVLYKEGKLLEWAKKENGELPDGIIKKVVPEEKEIITEG